MTSNIYDDEFLFNLAIKLQDAMEEQNAVEAQPKAVEDSQNKPTFAEIWQSLENMNEANDKKEEKELVNAEKEKADVTETKQIPRIDIEKVDLTPKEKEFINDLDEALKNIATLSDKEVKELYKELKVKFYANKNSKKQFKQSKKIVKKMIKSDKKRTSLRWIKKAGKYTAILSVVGAMVESVRYQCVPSITPYLEKGILDNWQNMVFDNLYNFTRYVPESQAIMGAFALGVVAYATGKGLVKMDDMKTLRRLMVQVCGEDMSIKELQAVKNAVKQKGNGVKEAMITYPLRDYGKSTDTLAKEEIAKQLKKAEAEAQKEQDAEEVEAKQDEKNAKESDEITR